MDGNAVWILALILYILPARCICYALPLYSTNAHAFYRLDASRSHAVPVNWFIYVYTRLRNMLQIGFVKTSYCMLAHIVYIFDILGKI